LQEKIHIFREGFLELQKELSMAASREYGAKRLYRFILSEIGGIVLSDIEFIATARRRRIIMEERLRLRTIRFRQKQKEKFGDLMLQKAIKRKQKKKEFIIMAKQTPEWFHYKEINYWIHRSALEHPHIRACIPLLLNNPSWTAKQKRNALDQMQIMVKNVQELTPEKKEMLEQIYGGIRKPPQKTLDVWVDPEWVQPSTYEELIAAAQAEMPRAEISRHYDAPVQPYPKPVQF